MPTEMRDLVRHRPAPGLTGRVLGALAAGAAMALVWTATAQGAGQAALGLVAEPALSALPHRWPPLSPDRPARVLMLGTSLTLQGEAWIAALETRLSACRPGGVVVERLARAGANSRWGETALAARLGQGGLPLPDALPDALIVEFSINDASLWHGLPLAQSRARHEAILTAAEAAGVPVWLATMSPAFGREALERPGQVAYRALYADLARAHGAGLVAMAPGWLALDPEARATALPDSLHPTEPAMTQVAVPALAEALQPMVCGAERT